VIATLLDSEIIPEIIKALPLDDLIVRLLLMASEDGKTEQSSTVISLMPELKQTLDNNLTLSALNKCLLKLGGSGTAPRKISAAYGFTPAQRRKIIFGVLTWLNEIIQPKLSEANYGNLDGYLAETSNFKVLTERVLPMLNNIKENSESFKPLSALLVNMHKLNPDLFEEILYTYDNRIIQTVGGIVGWEDELMSAEREAGQTVRQPYEDITLMPQEPEQALQQQEMQKRLYEEQLIQQKLREINPETVENYEQEFDIKNLQNPEQLLDDENYELQNQQSLNHQQRREWELQQQQERERIEQAKRREWELQQQQEQERIEQAKRRELELQQQQEQERMEQKKRREWELQQEQIEQEKRREWELQQQQEQERMEQAKRQEWELQQQQEQERIEQEKRREWELQQQQEQERMEQEKRREWELQQQQEQERIEQEKRREWELQQQQEQERIEQEKRREWELQQQQEQEQVEQEKRQEWELQQQQEQERIEQAKRQEWELQQQQEQERIEQEKRREWELQQEQIEQEKRREWELQQEQIEQEKRREWERQQYEQELEEQRQLESLKEQEVLRQRELKEQEQQQREIKQKQELQKKRELEEKQKWELERRQREMQQKQREREQEERKRLEAQEQAQRKREIQQKEWEIQQQREWELKQKREIGQQPFVREQHEVSPHERDIHHLPQRQMSVQLERDIQKLPQRQMSLQIQTRPPSVQRQITPPYQQKSTHDWVENQRTSQVSPRETSSVSSRDTIDSSTQRHRARLPKDNEWNENEINRRGDGNSGRDNEWAEQRGRDGGYYLREDRNQYPENIWQDRDHRILRDNNDWDERNGRLVSRVPRENDYGERNNRPGQRDPRENDWDERGRPGSRDLRENDWDERGRPGPRDPRENDWDERNGRPISRDYRENDWDERNGKLIPRDLRENDWDERNGRPIPRDVRGNYLNEKNRRSSFSDNDNFELKYLDITEPSSRELDREGSSSDGGYSRSERDVPTNKGPDLIPNQSEKLPPSASTNRTPVKRIVSLPPPPEQLGITDIDTNHQFPNIERFDLEEDEENDQSKDVSVNRITSIIVNDDVWSQLAAVSDNINPFFLNPEDRFGGAGVSTASPLTPIQEVPPSNVNEDKSPGASEQSTSSAGGSPSLGARTRALRRPERFQAVSPIPSAPQDRRLLLATLLARLNANSDIDNLMFRKLCYLSKETPLSAGAESADIWENGDRFSELITALLAFLENPLQNNPELKENALQLLQQLLLNQTEYVRGLERDLLRILLECRADPATNVCGQADEILDTYVQIVDPLLGLYTLIDIMESSLLSNNNSFGMPSSPVANSILMMNNNSASRATPKGSAFVVLGKL
ncbi:9890_t:CDS:2, partial [Ambispora leptoticha]